MPITREEFNERGKTPKYKVLFDFFKKNKNRAYSKKYLINNICKKIKMTRGQLNVSLYIWTKAGFLQNKRPYYIITNKGLKSDGKMKYDKEKKAYVPNYRRGVTR